MIPARLLNLLLLSALALAVGRFWAFLREPPPRLPAAATETAEQQRTQTAPAAPPAATPGGTEGYDVIVARDLFSPARGVIPPAPATAAPPAAPAQPPPKLTLYGVVILDDEKAAFLQEGVQETKPRKVREGERFAGGVVSAIRPDGVTFVFAGKEITVALRTPKEGLSQIPVPQPPQQPGTAAGGAPAVFPRQFTPPATRQPAGRIPQQMPTRVQPAFPQIPPTGEDEDELGDEDEDFQDGSDEFGEDDLEDSDEEDVEE
jgi:hypothetical protein